MCLFFILILIPCVISAVEAEIAECHDTVSLLRQSLHETEEREKVLTMQVMELERKLHEACETAEQLKEQLQDQNGEYEKGTEAFWHASWQEKNVLFI